MKKVVICPWCIQGIRSHGIDVYVGCEVESEDNKACESCGEMDDTLVECIIDD